MTSVTKKTTTALLLAALLVPYASVQAYAEAETVFTDEAAVSDTETISEYDNVITFTDNAISSENDTGVKIEGTELTVNAAGTYKLTGSCSEGSVKVKKGTTGVTLVLSGLTLTSSTTAPISVNKGSEAVIVVEGTNVIVNAEDPANETSEVAEVADAFEGAAIKVKSGAALTVTGTGTLTLDGSACKNGLKGGAEAQVVIGSSAADTFTLNITAKKNALACDGTLTVNGGNVNLTALEDGLKASPDDDDTTSLGAVIVNGGTITINAGEDGIQGDGSVTVNGGNTTVISADEGVQADGGFTMTAGTLDISAGGGAANASSEAAAKGVKSDGYITVSGGTLTIDSSDDAIHLNGTTANMNTIGITGGTVNISAGDDGIHSDYYLNIGEQGSSAGPVINITNAYEGIEGAVINFYSGSGTITTSEDGVNAANSDLSNFAFLLNVYGGKWFVNAGGDGLDSNGDLNIYGGYTEVFGSAQNDNAALDYGDSNNKFVFTGGTVVGIGTSGMAAVPTTGDYISFGQGGMGGGQPGGEPGSGGQPGGGDFPGGGGGQPGGGDFPGGGGQPGGQTGTAISIPSGASIVIKDSSGNTVYSTTALKAASHIVYASDTLSSNETYTLYINGSSVATATVGGTSVQAGVSAISMYSLPTKTTYTVGDTFDITGAQLKVTYMDGRTEYIDVTAEMISAVDMTTAGVKTVTVAFDGKTTSFAVTVNAKLDGNVIELGTSSGLSTVRDAVAVITNAVRSGTALDSYVIKLNGDVTETKTFTLPDVPITITADKAVTLTLKSTSLTAKNSLTLENITLTNGKKNVSVTAKKDFTAENSVLGAVKVTGHAAIADCTINGALTLSEKNASTVISGSAVSGKITAVSDLTLENCKSVGAITAKGNLTINGGDTVPTYTGAITASSKTGVTTLRNVFITKGSVKAAGALELVNCTITGNITSTGVTMLDGSTILGKLTAKSGLYVNGSSTVAGAVSTTGLYSDDDGNVLSYAALSVTKDGVIAGSKKLTLRVVTITDTKTYAYKCAALDPTNKKTNIAVKVFKGSFPADTLYISSDNCANAILAQNGTKLLVVTL